MHVLYAGEVSALSHPSIFLAGPTLYVPEDLVQEE
jgi:hypothetical protein